MDASVPLSGATDRQSLLRLINDKSCQRRAVSGKRGRWGRQQRTEQTRQPYAQLVAVSHTSDTLASKESVKQSAPLRKRPTYIAGAAEAETVVG